MSGKIFFRTDMEEQPVILDEKNYEDSFMKETINFAIDRFNKISGQNFGGFDEKLSNEIAPNNVIAFVGDRGTGKTSCMLSTINIIKQRENERRHGQGQPRNHFMEMLDPSFFDDEHSILDILIGKMFAEFYKDADERRNTDHQKQRDLLDSFKKVKDCLRFLEHKISYDEDSLEDLNNLAAGVTLKLEFRKLVDRYTEWFSARRLIIPIDDIDLNTVQAFGMMELIRKYIIQPNIIILFAVKIPQLTNAVKLQLTQQYNVIIGPDRQIPASEIARMADRYVEKFIPINSRVYMPDVDAILSHPIEILDGDRTVFSRPAVGDAVLELIFTKSRYLFYNTEGRYSLVIPRRLRELRQLVMLLYSLPDYVSAVSMYATSDDGRNNLYNKTTFKNYFFNAIAETLPASHRAIASALYGNRDFATFNKAVVDYLKSWLPDPVGSKTEKNAKDDSKTPTEVELARIKNSQDMAYNISLGDVLLLLNSIDDNSADGNMSQLVFFIKSYYSILLYELYDARNDDVEAGVKPSKPDKPLLQNQLLADIDNLRRLVGGSYITLVNNTFLAPFNNSDYRERRIIDGDLLKKYIGNIKSFWQRCRKDNLFAALRDGQVPEDAPIRAELKKAVRDLRTIEFFMLGTQRYDSAQSESYRQLPDVYYNRQLVNTKNIVFDISAPLFNILDIKAAYDRFDKDIFEICQDFSVGEYRSLYTMLTEWDGKRGKLTAPHERQEFLSAVTIRNVEILEDLCAYIRRHRDGRNRTRVGRTLSDIYATFYQTVAEYFALTYPKETKTILDMDNKDNYHHIQLRPFYVLYNFLRANPDGEFIEGGVNNELFNNIAKTVVVLSDDNVMQNHQKYTRNQVFSVILTEIPELADNDDFMDAFTRTFTMDNAAYPMGDITSKLARLSERMGVDFAPAMDSSAAKSYRKKIGDNTPEPQDE